MNTRNQIIIRNNQNLNSFLKSNSFWYKYLNRDANYINLLEKEMLEYYRLTTNDKIEDFSKRIETISQIIDILK